MIRRPTIALAALLAAVLALPPVAAAGSPKADRPGGKRAVAEVVSFEAAPQQTETAAVPVDQTDTATVPVVETDDESSHPSDRGRGKGKNKAKSHKRSRPATIAGTLTYVLAGQTETATVPVAEDLQVRLEHRGNHARGRGHGNPSRGDLADLVAGTPILRMKVKDGVLVKIALRPLPPVEATEET